MLTFWALLCTFGCLMASGVLANVMLMGNNVTLSFDDIEANFARPVKVSGEHGTIFLAKPLDACSPLTNNSSEDSINSRYVLIIRGGCSFDDKVRTAQAAGYKAAIVYNNDDSDLIAMVGDSDGIYIHAVFVSKASGLKLRQYVGVTGVELWLSRSDENSAWSIMALSFISLLAMSAVLAACFFVRRHHIRRGGPQPPRIREFHGMSSRRVKAMPSLVFTAVLEDNCTSATCAICLDDYSVGDKLRVLPCSHKFHTICVDAWLTSWRTFCPVCKRDARISTGDPPASEHTPLLSSSPASEASASLLSSVRSSYASRAIQIGPSSPSAYYTRSISNTSYNQRSLQSYHTSPSPSRSPSNIRNASSSRRSHGSHLNSLGYPSLSPLSSRYMSSYYPSPVNASSSYLWSSSRQPQPLHHSDSAANFSPYNSSSHIWSSSQQPHPLRHSDSAASFSPHASAQSLPEC